MMRGHVVVIRKGAIKGISVSGEFFARWRFATVKSARRLRRIKRGLLERVVIPRFNRLLQQALVGWSAHASFAKTVEPWLVVGADRNKMDAHFKSWWKHVSWKRDLSARQASLIQMNRRRTLFRSLLAFRVHNDLLYRARCLHAWIQLQSLSEILSQWRRSLGRIESAVSLSHRQSLSLCRRVLSSWKAHNNLMNSGRALNSSKLLKSLRAVVEGWKQVRDRCYNLRGSARAFRQYRKGIALWKKEQGMTDLIAIFAVRAKIFGHLSAWHTATERRILARSKLVTERLRANLLRWQERSRRNRLKRLLVFWRYQSRRSSLERRLIAVVTFAWLALGRQRKRWYLEHVFETWKESTKIARAVSKRVKQRAAAHHFIEWYGVLWTARAGRVGGYLRLAGRLAFCFTRWASISKSRIRIRQISWTRPTERGRIFAAWLRLGLAVRRGDLLTMRRSLKSFRCYHRHKIRSRLDDRRKTSDIKTLRQRKIWDFMRSNFVARDFDLRRAFKRYRKTVAVRRLKHSRRSALRQLILRKYFTRMQRLHWALLNSRINLANSKSE